jgi:predicted aspartyl protease
MLMRHTFITADPARLDEAVHYIADDARKLVEDEPGNVGMCLKVNRPLGIAVVETFWVSGDAMRESDKNVRQTRDAAAARASGTTGVESFYVASLAKLGPWEQGGGVRVTWADVKLSRPEKMVTTYEDTAFAALTDTEGFTGALLAVDERTGRSMNETLWTDEAALAASRSVAAEIRNKTVKVTDSTIRGLEEYSLVFSSARPN